MDSILHHLTFLRKTAEGLPHGKKFIEEAESKTGQKIENIFAGLEVVLALMVFWGFGASLIVNLVGFAYPGIATMLALESPEKEDDKKWLIYWIIFSALCLIEPFIDFVLYWVPFYYPIKLAFLLWLMLPQSNGAKFLYTTAISHFKDMNIRIPGTEDKDENKDKTAKKVE